MPVSLVFVIQSLQAIYCMANQYIRIVRWLSSFVLHFLRHISESMDWELIAWMKTLKATLHLRLQSLLLAGTVTSWRFLRGRNTIMLLLNSFKTIWVLQVLPYIFKVCCFSYLLSFHFSLCTWHVVHVHTYVYDTNGTYVTYLQVFWIVHRTCAVWRRTLPISL